MVNKKTLNCWEMENNMKKKRTRLSMKLLWKFASTYKSKNMGQNKDIDNYLSFVESEVKSSQPK